MTDQAAPTAQHGRCGAAVTAVFPGGHGSECALPVQHRGWHRSDEGTKWGQPVILGQGPTADDLWAWLLCCTDCGDEHEFRQVQGARDAWTWRHPDGHQYRTRAGNSLGALTQLRADWRTRHSPDRSHDRAM